MSRSTSSPVQSTLRSPLFHPLHIHLLVTLSFPTSQILHLLPLLLLLLNLQPRSRNFLTTSTTPTLGFSIPSFPRSTLLAHNLSVPLGPLQAVLLGPSLSSPSTPQGLASCPTLLESTQNILTLKLHLLPNYLLVLLNIHLVCITPSIILK